MPGSAPVVLLPPSEGKAPGGDGPAWDASERSWSELDGRRIAVAKALRAAMRKSTPARAKLLGVKSDALATATANLAVIDAPTMPAIDRYTGVLYDELDASSLSAALRRRLDLQVVIFSGLLGIVRATDQIPDYKLKMGATVGRPGKLSTWWRRPVTDALAPVVADRVVWDLLPGEHRAAWSPIPPTPGTGGAPAQIVSVRFLDEHPPTRRGDPPSLVAVADWNKLLKGSLVRYILATQLTDVGALADFEHPRGYGYRPALTENEGTLTRVAFVRPMDRHGDGPEKPPA